MLKRTPLIVAIAIVAIVAAVAAVVLFAGTVATRPAAYHVERRLEVRAPPDVAFAIVNDLRQFAAVWVLFGAPFESFAPTNQTAFDGPTGGVGQSLAWTGDSDAGTGKLTIEESIAATTAPHVRMKLAFVKPMESTAMLHLTLAPSPTTAAGTVVTWSMDGDHNFIGKAFGMFVDMDAMLGADIEQGLARLKTAAEGKHASPTALPAPP